MSSMQSLLLFPIKTIDVCITIPIIIMIIGISYNGCLLNTIAMILFFLFNGFLFMYLAKSIICFSNLYLIDFKFNVDYLIIIYDNYKELYHIVLLASNLFNIKWDSIELFLYDLEIKIILMQHDLLILKYKNAMHRCLNNVKYNQCTKYLILYYNDKYNLILLNLFLILLLIDHNNHNMIVLLTNNNDKCNLCKYKFSIIFCVFKFHQQLQHKMVLLMVNYIKNKHSKSIVLGMILLLLYLLFVISLQFFQYFQVWQLQHNQTFHQAHWVSPNKNEEKNMKNSKGKYIKCDFYSICNVVQQQMIHQLESFTCIIHCFSQIFPQIALLALYFPLSNASLPDLEKHEFVVFEKQLQHRTSQSMINYFENEKSTNMLFMIQCDFLKYFQICLVKHDHTSR